MPTTIIRAASPFYKNDSAVSPPAISILISTECPLLADEKLTSDGKVNPPTKITPIVTRSTPAPESRVATRSTPGPESRARPVTRSTPGPEFRVATRSTPGPESRVRPAPEFRVVSKASSQRHGSPYQKRVAFRRATSVASDQDSSNDSSSDLSDVDSDSAASSLSDDSKIPKPQGESGRPGRGGYTLQTALNWNSKAYAQLKNLTHGLVDEHLDSTKCASAQNPTLLKLVCDKATAAFPDLENYQNSWPVTDMIMMRLKYTSSRARRREIEMAAGKSHVRRKRG